MRTTLTLDDDVAALISRIQKERDTTFRKVVNDALRAGLEDSARPEHGRSRFQTRPMDLGTCYFGNLDNAWEVLAEAEEPAERG